MEPFLVVPPTEKFGSEPIHPPQFRQVLPKPGIIIEEIRTNK